MFLPRKIAVLGACNRGQLLLSGIAANFFNLG